MGYAQVNGARLAWQQLGEGPDLVMVHGLAANRAFWFAHASRLAERYRVTLFDLRGHGYSELAGSGYSACALAQDLLGLMDALQIRHTALAAHSYGGAAALEAALMAPQRIDALALFDVRIQRLQPQMHLHDLPTLTRYEEGVAEASTRAYGYDWTQEDQVGFRFLEATARLRADGLDAELRDSFTPFGEGRGALRAAKQWLRLLDETQARAEFLEAGAGVAEIAALRTPLLLMYARNSRCLPSAAALHTLLPQAHYREIADAGHFFPVSHASAVIAALGDFLESTAHAKELPCV